MKIYRWIAHKMGKEQYHTAEIRTMDEAREIYRHALTIKSAEACGEETKIDSPAG